MRKVKVYNDNQAMPIWKETFKGNEITIEYGKPIEMDFFEAHEFKGTFFPQKFLADQTQDPKSFKMIRVEKVDMNEIHQQTSKSDIKCWVCKKPFPSQKAMTIHAVNEHSDNLVDDGQEVELKTEAPSVNKKRIRRTKAQIEAAKSATQQQTE